MSACFRALAVGTAALVTASLTGVAHAGVDTTPPTLKADYHPRFAVGKPIDIAASPLSESLDYASAPVALRWTQRDASGIWSQSVTRLDAIGEETPIEWQRFPATRQELPGTVGFYDGEQGGATQRLGGWRIDSTDYAENTSRWFVSAAAAIADDTGSIASAGGSITAATYTSRWTVASGSDLLDRGFAMGTAHIATGYGEASLQVDVDRGSHFGVVAGRSPAGGSITISVDGTPVRTVDLSAARDRGARIVADIRLAAGTHTVVISTNGESGPVELDAFLLASGTVSGGVPAPGPLS